MEHIFENPWFNIVSYKLPTWESDIKEGHVQI